MLGFLPAQALYLKGGLLGSIVPVPAVNAAILNDDGKILLTRRSAQVREPHKWCLPGGHIEMGESWSQAITREVEEEVGLKIDTWTLCGIYSDPSLTLTPEPIGEGLRAQFVVALFLAKGVRAQVLPNEEVDGWDWCSPDRLPQPMLKSHPIRVTDAFSFQGKVFVR